MVLVRRRKGEREQGGTKGGGEDKERLGNKQLKDGREGGEVTSEKGSDDGVDIE